MKTFWILLFWNLKILIFQIFRFFQKNIFLELEKKNPELRFFSDNYSFDVKFSDLRQIWFPGPTSYRESTKTCSISKLLRFWVVQTGAPLSGAKNISPQTPETSPNSHRSGFSNTDPILMNPKVLINIGYKGLGKTIELTKPAV